MKRERNEKLKTDLEIKETARKKSNITTLIMCIVFATILIVMVCITTVQAKSIVPLLIIGVLIVIIFFFMNYSFLPIAFEESEKAKRSELYIKKYLSTQKNIEVEPLEDIFLLNLSEEAKFYAIIEEKFILIRMKFHDKPKYYDYTRILKNCFYDYYRVKE